MNSLERVMTVFAGGIPDRVPVALHNFLMAAKMAGIPLTECLRSGELLAESQLYAWRAFGHDALLVESGTTTMAEAIGCGVVMSDKTAPRIAEPALKSLDFDSINALPIPDPEKDYPLCEVIKAIEILHRELGDSVLIMGRADQAPLALAAALRGHEQFLFDLGLADSELIMALAEKCRLATTRYALALKNAGAHATCVGELGPDSISPTRYRELAVPNLKKFFEDLNSVGFMGGVHQCGNSVDVLDDMAAIGAKFLELDVTTDIHKTKKATYGKVAVLGMVDPANVLHRGSPELVSAKTKEAINILGPNGGFIVGPGCALVPEVPVENVEALIETAHKYGAYKPDGTLVSS